jgi:hypothetical protein
MKKSIVPRGSSFLSSFFDGQDTDCIHLVTGFLLSVFCIPSREAVVDCNDVDSCFDLLSLFLPKFNPMDSFSLFLTCLVCGKLNALVEPSDLEHTPLYLDTVGAVREGANAVACDVMAANRNAV